MNKFASQPNDMVKRTLGYFPYIILPMVYIYLIFFVIRQGWSDYLFRQSCLPKFSIEKQVDLLRQAIEINPNHPMYYDKIGLLYVNLANRNDDHSQAEKNKYYTLAIKNFHNSIAINPVNHQTQLHLASANYQMLKDLTQFSEAIKKIEKLDPYNKLIAEHKTKLLDLVE